MSLHFLLTGREITTKMLIIHAIIIKGNYIFHVLNRVKIH